VKVRVLGIDHVVLRVADVERSLAFYCNVLACHIERRIQLWGRIRAQPGSTTDSLGSARSAPPTFAGSLRSPPRCARLSALAGLERETHDRRRSPTVGCGRSPQTLNAHRSLLQTPPAAGQPGMPQT
jgi:catechol 2,3-dioxygenase-like lactoylglutathione lyase family enzyme